MEGQFGGQVGRHWGGQVSGQLRRQLGGVGRGY